MRAGPSKTAGAEEVGQIFSVTSERVRQIEAKAVRKLQQPRQCESLASFLDSSSANMGVAPLETFNRDVATSGGE